MPPLSPQRAAQFAAALERANAVRYQRGRLHAEFRHLDAQAGLARCAELLRSPPGYLETMEVGELLGWLKHWGPGRVNKLLAALRVPGNKPIAGLVRTRHPMPLSAREREMVAAALLRKISP